MCCIRCARVMRNKMRGCPMRCRMSFLRKMIRLCKHHAANHADDHPDIELADVANHFAAEVGFRQAIRMHLEADEFLVGAGMTLPAGLRQVGMIDGGARIAGGQNVMHTVTTGAIRHRR